MRVDAREAGEVIIVDLKGRLVSGTGDEVLRKVINRVLADRWGKIVLNLSEVTRIDSAGIGELVASIKLAKRFDSTVKLLNVHGQVRDILELCQILPLLEVYESEEEALQAFAEGDDTAAGSPSGETQS